MEKNTQKIAFIDPKGLKFSEGKIEDNSKLLFNVIYSKIYEKLINKNLKEQKVKFYGFFISTSESAKITSSLGKTLNKKQLEDIGIYFFDNYDDTLPILKVKKYEYLEKIFEKLKISSELDEYLRAFLEKFDLDKQITFEELKNVVFEILDDKLANIFLGFLTSLKFVSVTDFPLNIKELMLYFIYFWLEKETFLRLLNKEILEQELRDLGATEEEIIYISEEIYALSNLQYLIPYIVLLIIVSKKKAVELIKNLINKAKNSKEDYITPDISMTGDSSER